MNLKQAFYAIILFFLVTPILSKAFESKLHVCVYLITGDDHFLAVVWIWDFLAINPDISPRVELKVVLAVEL